MVVSEGGGISVPTERENVHKHGNDINAAGDMFKQSVNNSTVAGNDVTSCEDETHSEATRGSDLHDDTTGTVVVEEGQDDEVVTMDTEARAIDGGWGWLIVLGALLLRTVIGGLGRSHGLFYVKFKERYNGTATETSLVTSLTGFLRLSAGPIVSILSGRFPCRVLTAIGAVTLFLGLILTAFSVNLQFLYFSYGIVTGIGRALTLTPVPILLGYYFDKRRSLAFGLASAGFSIGGFAITPVVELLFQHYGYQGTFLILSGFALNVLVSSALFRPIELHRKLSKRKPSEKDDVELRLISNPGKTKSNIGNHSPSIRTCSDDDTEPVRTDYSDNVVAVNENNHDSIVNDYSDNINTKSDINRRETGTNINTSDNVTERSEQYDKLINTGSSPSVHQVCTDQTETEKETDKPRGNQETIQEKKTLISWSILKDTRFLSYVFATFCFTLPASGLFLPALAKSKGLTEIQAATLLSTAAGADTLFRVLSGIILDLRMFRSIRPQIYNGITFIQGSLAALYPLMSNYTEFMVLSACDGAIAGIKNAQGAVIIMDMLGVDKLASSMAVTMTVQCVAVFLGPTISGQLIDNSGSYNGAFYFASAAILTGAVVMAGGNIAKHYKDYKDRQSKEKS